MSSGRGLDVSAAGGPALPLGLIHPDWRGVIVPSYSRTHPTVLSPFNLSVPKEPKRSLTSQRKCSAVLAPPSPGNGSERSTSTGTSSTLVASEIFFSGHDFLARRGDDRKKSQIKGSVNGNDGGQKGLDRYVRPEFLVRSMSHR
jgi:hypothetical protein